MRKHLVISGTGRAGTSYLIQLLTYLGLDTGFNKDTCINLLDPIAHAGLEYDIRRPDCPYIIKYPNIGRILKTVLANPEEIGVELVWVPIRNLDDVVHSRIRVQEQYSSYEVEVAGGLTGTTDPHEQRLVLLEEFYSLMQVLAHYSVPVRLIDFSKMMLNKEYLADIVMEAFPQLTKEEIYTAYGAITNQNWISSGL